MTPDDRQQLMQQIRDLEAHMLAFWDCLDPSGQKRAQAEAEHRRLAAMTTRELLAYVEALLRR